MINQLFREKPSRELACKLVHYCGLAGLQDTRYFSRFDMQRENTIKKINEHLIDNLKKLYIRCKAESYLSVLDEHAVITILRQVLRIHGYTVISRTRCVDGIRFTEYKIQQTSC